MIGVTPRFDVMVSDLILSLKVTPTVLLMNFISAAVILLLSVFFSAHTSHPYVIIGTGSVLYTFSLVSFCTLLFLRVLFINPVTRRNLAILPPTSTGERNFYIPVDFWPAVI